MSNHQLPRRDFLKLLAAAFPAAYIDWDAFPSAVPTQSTKADYDVVVIGSGLAGLSCAAAFARKGFKPLVIEQHDKPGGFATAFARPGGFLFDVSLHSTSVGERNGIRNLIYGLPEIADVEFLPHPSLLRAIFPEHDIRVAQKDPAAFVRNLCELFPEEKAGINGLFDDMKGLSTDIGKLSRAAGNVDMSRFPLDFPHLFKFHTKTWGEMMGERIQNQKLKAIVSSQWEYYGLPPSKLSCFYYALPFLGYLTEGGYYPKGRSQSISDALAGLIIRQGGKILLNTRVDKILTKANAAHGVGTSDGKVYSARAVVSNASPHETFRRLLDDRSAMAEYEMKWEKYSVSISCFQVFLGLNQDLVRKLGIGDSELFLESSYDPESAYERALSGDMENATPAVTLYDNIYPGYSPSGKNTVNLMCLQGFAPWEQYEKDYRAGNKGAYRREKERRAALLIAKAETLLLPGLSKAIEVQEIGTPLTNLRYTGHHRGAIYGWDQTVGNSGSLRVGHSTPVKNLYLAGAWSRPGHGYGAVIPSGLECFGEIVKSW